MWIKEKWQSFSGWLDNGGFPAWLIASVFGWIVFWPIGLFLTINMIMRKENHMCRSRHHMRGPRPTGNSAFDNYRRETLQRLEEERQAFAEYLQRLRDARDKEEFDGWMKEMTKADTAKA